MVLFQAGGSEDFYISLISELVLDRRKLGLTGTWEGNEVSYLLSGNEKYQQEKTNKRQ